MTDSLDLETINKLFLELSQISTATTQREKDLADVMEAIIQCVEKKVEVPHLLIEGAKGLIARTKL